MCGKFANVHFDGVISLNLSKYGRIGKAPLIKAIGVQKNHKEIIYTETQELDRVASGCYACDNYNNIEFFEYMPREIQDAAKTCCANCPYAVYKTVVHETERYINEKNMYGNQPRLKAIALKLLLIYHFSYPDENGLVSGLSARELASYIGCSTRSIHNANDALMEYGYILHCKDGCSKRKFQVFLKEYKSYSLPADQGGRGYATFNRKCLDELVRITDLNQLRILLRAALDIDTNRDPQRELILFQDFDSLRRFLPGYCKPGIIRRALSSITNLFSISFDEEQIQLKMDPAFHGRRIFEAENNEHTSQIKTYIESLDKAMNQLNLNSIHQEAENQEALSFLTENGITSKFFESSLGREIFHNFHLGQEDYKDLGLLCTTYSFEQVKSYISYVYEKYHVQSKIQRIGALIRSLLKDTDFVPASLPAIS